MEELISRDDILKYGYYDDSKYIVVIDKKKLEQFLNADEVIFEEVYK